MTWYDLIYFNRYDIIYIYIHTHFCNRIGVSGSRAWVIDHPNISLNSWVIPFHPFMPLVSFLKLIETICQQLFSQCSRFSPYYFNIKFNTIWLLTLNSELDWTGLKEAMCLRIWIRLVQNEFETYMKSC